MKLKIIYDGLPDFEFEDILRKFFKAQGFKFVGEGYNMKKDKRDIEFEKEVKNELGQSK